MKKLGAYRWFSCCAGVCLVVAACSSEEDDGRRGGSGGTDAVGGSVTGGRAGGGAAGAGIGGTSAAGSGGRRPRGGTGGRPEGGTGGGGAGGTCDEDVTDGLIQLTLEEYCQDNDCPETLEQARASVRDCRAYQYSEETTGCGYTVVRFYGEEWGYGYAFDEGALVGAYWFDDIIEPPCDTHGVDGGVFPPACPGADSCRICDQEDGSGGAGPFCDFGGGGEGGVGGQGS